jgi:hypothetical protein
MSGQTRFDAIAFLKADGHTLEKGEPVGEETAAG